MTTDQCPRAALTAGEIAQLRRWFHADVLVFPPGPIPTFPHTALRALDELEQLRREQAQLVAALREDPWICSDPFMWVLAGLPAHEVDRRIAALRSNCATFFPDAASDLRQRCENRCDRIEQAFRAVHTAFAAVDARAEADHAR